MLANSTRTPANVGSPEFHCGIRVLVHFSGRWRILANAGGLSMWWARQDSNLQPDRYERESMPAFNRVRSVLMTSFLVRNWCGIQARFATHQSPLTRRYGTFASGLRRLLQCHLPQLLAESASRPRVTIQSRLSGNPGRRYIPRRIAITAAQTDDDECRYAPVELQSRSRQRQPHHAPDCRRP